MMVHNYTEWNEYNKLEVTLESPKTESSKFSVAVQIWICSGEWMGRDLHVIRCSAQVTVGLIDLVQYWHLSLKTGVARYQISFWMAIVPAHPLSKALSHTRSQHLMFRMCFRDWCLLASVRVRFLSILRRSSSALWTMDVASLGYLRHLSVIPILGKVALKPSALLDKAEIIHITHRQGPKRSWTKCVIIAGIGGSRPGQALPG